MRLIKCHIENFGKLSDFDYDFNSDFNLIFANNGWGKSTFAAFLKVMFYGFDNDAKRSPEKERNRYKPWQGGVYGGSITFQIEEKEYILTRSFDGTKPANDQMELRDAKTNLISNDYSQNIGEELFSIDGESFKKSIFIHQGNCASTATDGINAKMGNLSDTTDDISRFEKAGSIITAYLNNNSLTRATGKLVKDKKEIEHIKQNISGMDMLEESIARDNTEVAQLEEQRKEFLIKRDELLKQQAKVSEYKDVQAKKATMDSLKDALTKRQAAFEEAKIHFPKGSPSENEAGEAFELLEEYEASLNVLEGLEFAKKDRQKLSELRAEYGDDLPTVESIKSIQKDWNDRQEKVKKADSLQDKIDNLEMLSERESKESSKGNSGMTVLGVIVLIAGVALFVLGNMGYLSSNFGMLGAVVAMAGIVIAIVGMLFKGKTKETHNPSLDRIEAWEREIEKLDAETESIDIKVEQYLNRYNKDFEESQVNNDLFDLRSMVTELDRIKENAKKFDEVASKCSAQKKELERFADRWGIPVTDRLLVEFKGIKADYVEYQAALKELKQAEDSYEKFENSNGGKESLAALNEIKAPEGDSVVKLNNDIESCNESLRVLERNINGVKNRLDSNLATLDDLKEMEEVLEAKTLEYEKNKEKYHTVKKTKELLEEAHNSFLLKYSAPLKEAFDKYYNLITSNADDIYIDVKSNITKMEQGAQRELFYMSSGYQDLIGICLRLAFVSAMYKEEKPFIILDDPFSNLDGEKTEKVKELLKMISKEYQVIYFTCHEELA